MAAVVEHDDAVAQQTPALPGVIGDDPGCQVIGCRPLRAPRLMLTHCFLRYKAVRAMPSRASCPQYRPSPGRAPVRACVADPLRLPGFTIATTLSADRVSRRHVIRMTSAGQLLVWLSQSEIRVPRCLSANLPWPGDSLRRLLTTLGGAVGLARTRRRDGRSPRLPGRSGTYGVGSPRSP